MPRISTHMLQKGCSKKFRAFAVDDRPVRDRSVERALGPWRSSVFKAARDVRKGLKLGELAEVVQGCTDGGQPKMVCNYEEVSKGVKLYCSNYAPKNKMRRKGVAGVKAKKRKKR